MKNNTFKEWVAPILVLVCICLVITGALAYTNSITKPIIEENEKNTADATRAELLPEGQGFTQYDGELLEKTSDGKVTVQDVYTADNGAGMVITVVTKSFGGNMTQMIGIDKDGKVTGVRITKHSDTAGLGDKAHNVNHTQDYTGVSELNSVTAKDETEELGASNDGAWYITGATISSNAVHYGVKQALEQFKAIGGAK